MNFHPVRAEFDGIGDVQRLGVEGILEMADIADLFEIAVGQDRLADFEALLLRGALMVQDVRTRADEGDQAHHQLLADRVDRRVGDLGEVLLEIIVEQLGLRRHRRDRRVAAHRADGFLAGHGHGRHQDRGVFLGVAEGLLAVEQRHVGARGPGFNGLEIFEQDLGALEPFAIGMRGGEALLDLVVRDDAALLHVDQQHAAGLEAPFGDDLLFRNRQHAHFRGHDHQTVLGHEIARRTQAVAVERRADLASVGEGDGGGAVPRLHQRGVIFVERAALLVHQRIAGPGFGNQHHHGVGHGIAALNQEFERVVETGGVRLAFVGDRPQLGNVVAEQRRGDRGLARRHPVDVAAQRVDLAVMRDHAIGMGQLPRREGVGRESLVHEGDAVSTR